jgi:hypothetical protein
MPALTRVSIFSRVFDLVPTLTVLFATLKLMKVAGVVFRYELDGLSVEPRGST